MRIHETDLKYNEKQSLLATAKIIDLATVLEVALLGYIKNRKLLCDYKSRQSGWLCVLKFSPLLFDNATTSRVKASAGPGRVCCSAGLDAADLLNSLVTRTIIECKHNRPYVRRYIQRELYDQIRFTSSNICNYLHANTRL